MEFKFKVAPHYKQKLSTQRIMNDLTLGLLVVYAFGLYKSSQLGTGYVVNALVLMGVSLLVALVTEAVYAMVLKKNVVKYLKTSFGWITAIILTLMVPVNTEPYALGVATFIAIFFGKLVFGGFGQNIFNPAAVGRAVIFASFAGSISADLVTTATPTSTLSSSGWLLTSEGFATFLNDFGGIGNLFFGTYAGSLGETSTLLIMLVGVYLAVREVIDWRVPVTYLGVIFFGALGIGMTHGLGIEYALFHLCTGGAVFGAVFMLTDPVTNPNTRAGRIVFAALAGILTMTIRLMANLPEGVLYSILLVNTLTPVIDKYFDGKQVLREKKNLYTVVASIVVAVVAVCLIGTTLSVNEKYKSLNVPTGETISINDDYSKYNAKLDSQSDNTYVIKVKGFGLLDPDGMASATGHEYSRNTITVTVDSETSSVTAVEFTEFGDTAGFGDKCLEDIFMNQFDGATLDTEVNCVTGATYTSKSVVAAVKLALQGGSSYVKGAEVALGDDYAKYGAKVEDLGNGKYHITVKGFGLIDPDGMASATGHEYSRNEFDVTVKDGKVTKVEFTKFGDTAGFGDKCMDSGYLESFNGKGLSDKADTITSATYTSKSVAAAVNAALLASEGE